MAIFDDQLGGISDAALATRLTAAGLHVATASSATPAALGTAAAGSATSFARGDHVHSSSVAAGGSTTNFGIGGNITTQVSAAGVSPGATSGDYVLATYTIPASAFDVAGREIKITGFGQYAANGNTKQLKIYVGCTTATVGSAVSGGTAIADSGAVTANSTGWRVVARVLKYGAAASNTQMGFQDSSTTSSSKPTALTLTESGAIKIAVTGNATTTATDIVLNGLVVEYAN
jgi:hypothetical protein